MLLAVAVAPAFAITGPCSSNIVITQVYGGGGNTGATYLNDFVELHNPGINPINLAGFAIQYGSFAGTTWQVYALPNTILGPGGYFLIQAGPTGVIGSALPPPDAVAPASFNLANSAGKVALTSTTTMLTTSCPVSPAIVDLVGYGTANCFEGPAPAPSPSNSTSVKRIDTCVDTNNNSTDFSVGTPTPRNATQSAPQICECTVNETGAAQELDYCNLQFPPTMTVTAGTMTPAIYARVFESGYTEMVGANPGITAQIGYGAQGIDPSTQPGFVWFTAAYNTQIANDDEYQHSFTAPAPGTYRYASRFTLDGVNWTYGDLDGAGSNQGLDFSAAQLGTMTVTAQAFTDDPLATGVTPVKAIHITELRSRVDAQRTRFGLMPFTWADNSLAAGMPVRAVHVAELRAALEEAYTHASMMPPTFTEPIVAGTTVVKAMHITELRNALVFLEGS